MKHECVFVNPWSYGIPYGHNTQFRIAMSQEWILGASGKAAFSLCVLNHNR